MSLALLPLPVSADTFTAKTCANPPGEGIVCIEGTVGDPAPGIIVQANIDSSGSGFQFLGSAVVRNLGPTFDIQGEGWTEGFIGLEGWSEPIIIYFATVNALPSAKVTRDVPILYTGIGECHVYSSDPTMAQAWASAILGHNLPDVSEVKVCIGGPSFCSDLGFPSTTHASFIRDDEVDVNVPPDSQGSFGLTMDGFGKISIPGFWPDQASSGFQCVVDPYVRIDPSYPFAADYELVFGPEIVNPPQNPVIFFDGFESGDTSAWSI